MQLYFFDIHFKGETITDEEGARHFDDGSAIYYARTIANRISRTDNGDMVRVHIRDSHNRLLTIAIPSACRPLTSQQAQIQATVERDLARQRSMAG